MLFAILHPVLALANDLTSQARRHYREGNFQSAVNALKDPIERGELSGGDLREGLEVLWRSQFRLGQLGDARSNVFNLLSADSTWRPNPDRVPPDEVTYFVNVLPAWRATRLAPPSTPSAPPMQSADAVVPKGETSHKGGSKKAWYIAGGVVVVGVVAAILLQQDHPPDEAKPLGGPPDPPAIASPRPGAK